MDFDLPDTVLAVRDGVAAVAAKHGHDYWSRCEDEKRYPIEVYRDLAEGGWLGLSVPEEYGGGGRGEADVAKLTAARAVWEAADQAFQTLGGMAYSKDDPVELMVRDARIGKNIPVSEQMVLAHIDTSMLDLPRTY